MDTSHMAQDMTLENFVNQYPLPQFARVTQGYLDKEKTENEFSTNDIIKIVDKACTSVSIRFRRSAKHDEETTTVPTSNTTLFRLALSAIRARAFASVRQLVSNWPLAVKALDDHVPPPGEYDRTTSIHAPLFCKAVISVFRMIIANRRTTMNEILHLIRLTRVESHPDSCLELRRDTSSELLCLPLHYQGPFLEIVDLGKLYTLRDLILSAKVGRKLILRYTDRRNPKSWIAEIPADFDGTVFLDPPEYSIEVQSVLKQQLRRRLDVRRASMTDFCKMGPSVFVPMKNEIRIEPHDEARKWYKRPLLKLSDVVKNYTISDYPLIVRIVNWAEETITLKKHYIRPLQLLVIFEQSTVEKMAVVADGRRFLIPLTHNGTFRQVANRTKFAINDLWSRPSSSFPVYIEYSEVADYVNVDDDVLPMHCSLKVEGVVSELSLLVGQCMPSGSTGKVFQLPVRTKIDVSVESTRAVMSRPGLSSRNEDAEEINEQIYDRLLTKIYSNDERRTADESNARPMRMPRNVAEEVNTCSQPSPFLGRSSVSNQAFFESPLFRTQPSGPIAYVNVHQTALIYDLETNATSDTDNNDNDYEKPSTVLLVHE